MAPAGTCTTFTTGKPDIGLPPWLWLVETNTGSLDVLGCAWIVFKALLLTNRVIEFDHCTCRAEELILHAQPRTTVSPTLWGPRAWQHPSTEPLGTSKVARTSLVQHKYECFTHARCIQMPDCVRVPFFC